MFLLKDAFIGNFYIGTALNNDQVSGKDTDSMDIMKKNFNSITAENSMKWSELQKEPHYYDFKTADRFVALGEENKMHIVGHTLVWHNQVPSWVFTDDRGNPVSRETLLQRMRDHIFTVIGHYKGRVHGWDVVNEALADDGRMRNSNWLAIIGEDYIGSAFEFAREADRDAELYYNDYSLCVPAKRDGAIRLIRYLQANRIKVDGIGMQGHLTLGYPEKIGDFEDSIIAFSELGLKVMITEMDISVLPFPDMHKVEIIKKLEYQNNMDPFTGGLPDSVQEKLADRYYEFFKIFLKHKDKISRVTIWGIYDGQSWLNNWPVKGRTDYPLLYDRHYRAKPAYLAVLKSAENYML